MTDKIIVLRDHTGNYGLTSEREVLLIGGAGDVELTIVQFFNQGGMTLKSIGYSENTTLHLDEETLNLLVEALDSWRGDMMAGRAARAKRIEEEEAERQRVIATTCQHHLLKYQEKCPHCDYVEEIPF